MTSDTTPDTRQGTGPDTTGDPAVDAALATLREAAEHPHHDPQALAAAVAAAHEALRARLADAG